ncbi:MAG: signal recognition particle protein Srp54, partial [Candidatus Bathyarchaeia archaeon]
MTSLEDLGKSLSGAVRRLLRLPLIDEKAVEELVKDLQRALLQSDVNVKLVLGISEKVFERSLKEKLPAGISRREHVIKVLYEELTRFLGEKPATVSIPQKKPYVLMLIGIQGSGKTTGAVKIGRFYQKRGVKVALVCADTYRPGAYVQLKQLADKVNIPVYWDEEKSPESMAVEAVSKLAKEGYQLIIIDTAGRHKNEKELMNEMRRLEYHIKPDEVMLVLDGTIGQQALSHAEAFQNATRVGSIYVTKLDGSARGGGALSAVAATQAKVKFIGVGEKIDDIEPFDPARFVGRLLGMGDLETLIEKVKEAEIEPSEKKTRALMEGKFTLKDLYEQVESMRKLGPLKKILGMMPGGLSVDAEQLNLAEKKFKDWRVIIQSMRSDEIEDPRIIDSSRARRIARGSGKSERDVKELIEQYFTMKKMVKTLRKRHGVLQKKFLFEKNI